jgi:N-acylneuraminate cytidylyltransferase/CMP-N,N'-diacetyllegionaminic acid synthase
MKKREVLAFIPARAGSKRIRGKNSRLFHGKPLIAHTIEHALRSRYIDRTVVCTESPKIAAIARKYGAEVVPRPASMATDVSHVMDSVLHTLETLRNKESYVPTHFVILQATSPLREEEDIKACFDMMEKTGATTVLTVAPTHPLLCHLNENGDLYLANGKEKNTSTHKYGKAYLLNGCAVYVIKTTELLREKQVHTKKTKAVIMPKWRSIDLDDPEEWAMAEVIYKNKNQIRKSIAKIEHDKR